MQRLWDCDLSDEEIPLNHHLLLTSAAALNINVNHCYNFTSQLFLAANSTRSLLSLISVLISILVLTLRILQCYRRSDLMKHTDRLMVYACVTTTLYASFESVQFVRILNWDTACTVVGALVEYTSVSVLVITACIGCHLLVLLCQTRCMKVAPDNADKYKRHEVVYVLLTFLLPLLLVPWPFLSVSGSGYGKSGAFCWINFDDGYCRPVWKSVMLLVMLYYVWIAIVGPFTLVVVVTVIATLCLRKSQKVRCSTYAILVYMMAFLVSLLVNVIGGGLLLKDSSAVHYLMVQVVSEPFFTLFTTAILLAQLCWSKCHKRSHKKFAFDHDADRFEESQLFPIALQ